MNNTYKIAMILCLMPGYTFSIFERDRATRLAQQGSWKEASAMIQPLLVNNAQDPSLFFDAGVMAYKAGEFTQAAAYWKSVIDSERASDNLKERAYFNLGNVSVQLNKLEDAINNYESALALNSEHEQVRHNLEKVKEILEQQQEEKQKEQQSGDGQSRDEDQSLQQQDRSSSGGTQRSESGEHQQKDDQGNMQTDGDQEHGNESQDKNQLSQEAKKTQKNDQSAQGDQQQHDKQADSSDEQKGYAQDKEREDEQDKIGTSSEQKNGKEDQQAKKGDAQQLAQQNTSKGTSIKEQTQEEQEQEPVPSDPKEARIAKILDAQEKADERAAKMLMRRNMNKKVAGQRGLHNW